MSFGGEDGKHQSLSNSSHVYETAFNFMAIIVFRGTRGESYLCLLHNKLKIKLCGCVGSLNPFWAVECWFWGVLNVNSAHSSAKLMSMVFYSKWNFPKRNRPCLEDVFSTLLRGKSLAAPAVSRWMIMADTPNHDKVTCAQGSAHCSGATKSTEPGELGEMSS